jgi:multidrug efflux system membrane fusion protein
MAKKLLNKFTKIPLDIKIVAVSLIIVVVWMASILVFKGLKDKGVKEVEPLNYKIVESNAVKTTKSLHFTGITKAEQQVKLAAELSGNVLKLLAQDGELLKKGDGVVEIELKGYLQKYNSAKEDVLNKEIIYKSALDLKSKGFSSRSDVAYAKSQLLTAQANLKDAKINMDNAIVKAPYDGIINKINVKVGDYLSIGSNVGSFLSNEIMRVNFYVPEYQFNDVKNATYAYLFVDGKKIGGNKIYSLSYIANNKTKTYTAEVIVSNKEFILKSGQVIDVVVKGKEILAHKISQSTLGIDINGVLGVKILNKDNVVEFIPVEIVNEDADGFWVVNLPKYVRIITLGHFYVKQGDKLQHTPSNQDESVNKSNDGKDL